MKKISMVDLAGQLKPIAEEVNLVINNVIENTSFINGPAVANFQKNLENYLNVKHVIPCANGTDALQIALMSLDLNPGDEVITVDFTFASTVEVIALLKLTPVLVDVDPETFNINIDSLDSAITEKSKVIIPVHLFGQVANMDEVIRVAKKHNLEIIEDTAQAFDSSLNDKFCGTFGDIGTLSMHPLKTLNAAGDAGAVITNSRALAEKVKALRNIGQARKGKYDKFGYNSRLDNLQAKILLQKLISHS